LGTKRRRDVRGVQFDAETLGLIDDLCRRRGLSRSRLIRQLVRAEAARDGQEALPGFGNADDVGGV